MSSHSVGSHSRSPSPDHDGSPEKRASKKRKVLSCYACRNRKMKCDRIFPVCGRCARTGRSDACSYDPRMVEEILGSGVGDAAMNGAPMLVPNSAQHNSPFMQHTLQESATVSDSVAWKLQMQQRRIEMLERKLASLNTAKDDSSYVTPNTAFGRDDDAANNIQPPRELMMFRGHNFKTHFYGSTSPLAFITQFPEVHAFTRNAMSSNSSMARIKGDFKSFRASRKIVKTSNNHQTVILSDADILSLIPQREIVNDFVMLYFQHYEATYRILHKATFWRNYERFWSKPANCEPSFPVVLLLVIATARCLSEKADHFFIGDSSSGREEAAKWIEAAESWVARQSRKHLTLSFFQVQCLLVLARRANSLKSKQDWIHTGELMRCALSAGLHRDPAFLGVSKTKEFNKEMRRRIWATIVELELQSCIDKGIQSSITSLDFDCPAPANADDDAFCPDSVSPPSSKPLEDFTTTSYLHASRRSLHLRIHLTSLLNAPKSGLQYEEVLHYDAQINAALATLPTWDPCHTHPASTFLDLQLRQFLLILHQPFAKLAASNPRYAYSSTALLNSASKMLTQYRMLADAGSNTLNFLRNDVFRATLFLSQCIYANLSNTLPMQQTPHDIAGPNNPLKSSEKGKHANVSLPAVITSNTNNFLLSSFATSAAPMLESALDIFETKMLKVGTGYMEYWLMAAATGLAAPAPASAGTFATDKEEFQIRGQKMVQKIKTLCYKLIELQPAVGTELGDSLRVELSGAVAGGPGINGHGGSVDAAASRHGDGDGQVATGASVDGILDIGLGVGALDDMPTVDSFESADCDLGWAWTDFWDFDMGDL